MKKSLKRALADKDLTVGSWLSFAHAPLCEMMAGAGFDWLVIDLEHTSIDFREAADMIRIIELSGCVPLVRVGENHPTVIKRVMDSGARGVVVPMVNSAEEARRAVGSVYYPPAGFRGAGLFRAQDYGAGFQEYRSRLEREGVVIVQIEHIRAVENLKNILDVEGVDGFIVGPYDLSASLNLPGQFDHPRVTEALNEIAAVMRTHPKPGGFHVVHSSPSELKAAVARGYRFVAYGDDMVFFSEKLAAERAAVWAVRNGD
jgi:2-keto-3-deoxy-L-rhamnonate aldolase RhmA